MLRFRNTDCWVE